VAVYSSIDFGGFFRRGKVSQVRSKDYVGTPANGCGQHVSVIWIGKQQAVNQIFIPGDERISCVGIHQRARALQISARQVRALT
jgi:hypothetical protein